MSTKNLWEQFKRKIGVGPLTGVFFLFFIYKPVTFIIFNFKNYPENIYIYIYIYHQAMRSNLSRKQYSMVKRYICKYKQAKYSSSEYNVTSRARRFFPVKFYFITSIILLRIFAWRSVIFFSFFFGGKRNTFAIKYIRENTSMYRVPLIGIHSRVSVRLARGARGLSLEHATNLAESVS